MKTLLLPTSIMFFMLSAFMPVGQTANAQSLSLTGVESVSAAPGTAITLQGSGFDAAAGDNTVTFTPVGGGTGTDATPTSVTATTRLTVVVPAGLSGGLYELEVTRGSDAASTTLASPVAVITGNSPVSLNAAITGLTGMDNADTDWGDYDGDGDLDLVMSGSDGQSSFSTIIYKNDGAGSFTAINIDMPGMDTGSADWVDVDGDGDLDLLLTGTDDTDSPSAEIYENTGSDTFTAMGAGLTGVSASSAAIGDVDGDGDMDLLITGEDNSGSVSSAIYENNGSGSFTAMTSTGLAGFETASSAFGDMDNDGDLDLVIAGKVDGTATTTVYENDGSGSFTELNAGLTGVSLGSAAWGDYNADGNLDLVVTGTDDSFAATAIIYKGDGAGGFTDISAGLAGVSSGDASWGDVDADGDLDLVVAGFGDGFSGTAALYINEGSDTFTASTASLDAVEGASISWAEVNGDGDVDLLVTGLSAATFTPSATLYLNGNDAPKFTSSATASVPEGIATTETVFNVNANDGEGGDDDSGVTYSITGGDDTANFSIDAASGELTFTTEPDFENPADANTDNDYLVTVQADDGESSNNTTTQEITITVTDVNEAPSLTLGATSGSLDENNNPPNVLTSITINDDGLGTNTLSLSGADAGSFNINASNELEFSATADFETKGSFEVTVEVDDADLNGSPDDTQNFTLSINDVNEAPVVANPLVDQMTTENESFEYIFSGDAFSDVDGDVLTYTASLDDDSVLPDWLSFNGAERTFSGTPAEADVETLMIEVTAEDAGGLTVSDVFELEVEFANSIPTGITLSSTQVEQSGGENAVVGALSTTDADEDDTHSYTLVAGEGDTHNENFNINGSELRANDASAMALGDYEVRIQTEDNRGDTFAKSFTIAVIDVTAPSFENATPTVENIKESGATLSADLDEEGTVFYVVAADGDEAPSVSQIKAGQNSEGTASLAAGSFTTSSTTGSDDFTGLDAETAYDLFAVAQDDESTPNVQDNPVKLDFTTLMGPPAAGTFTPGDGATDVELDAVIVHVPVSVTFDQDVTEADLSGVTIADGSGNNVTGVVATLENRKLSITHDKFAELTEYTVSIPAGAVENTDGKGNEELSWSFNTAKITFLLAENEVTITCSEAGVGETGRVNGVTYTKRDRAGLFDLHEDEDHSDGNNPDFATTCTSGVEDMSSLFRGIIDYLDGPTRHKFNQDISHWDVSSVTNMRQMFRLSFFNRDIGSWDVSNVTNMSEMFRRTTAFNKLLPWDVSKVTDMSQMFEYATAYNKPIWTWDVSNVTNMADMFHSAESFDQNLGPWIMTNVQCTDSKLCPEENQKRIAAEAQADSISGFLVGSGLSTENADSLFMGLAEQDLQDGVSISIGDIELSEEGATAMKTMRETNNMVVAWGGQQGVEDKPVFTALPAPFQVKTEDTRILPLWEYVSDVETPDNELEFKFDIISDSAQTVGFDNTNGELSITAAAYADTFQVAIQVANNENIVSLDTMEVQTNSSFPTSAELMAAALPTEMELNQNYPNPFNPTTVIRYGVPQSSKVRLEVFDLLGRKVATLVNNKQQRAGWHQVNFDAGRLASGIYLYRIVAGDYVETRKMLLIK